MIDTAKFEIDGVELEVEFEYTPEEGVSTGHPDNRTEYFPDMVDILKITHCDVDIMPVMDSVTINMIYIELLKRAGCQDVCV